MCHFPELLARYLPTSMKLPVLEGGKKEEKQDSLITILRSSYCQMTYHAVVEHVRLAKPRHVI